MVGLLPDNLCMGMKMSEPNMNELEKAAISAGKWTDSITLNLDKDDGRNDSIPTVRNLNELKLYINSTLTRLCSN